MGVMPWSPLRGGLLGGAREQANAGRRSSHDMQRRIDEQRSQLEQYEQFCRGLGAQPADVALAWLLHQPAVTAPIIGPRTQDQLDGALRALELQLTREQLARLDEIFP